MDKRIEISPAFAKRNIDPSKNYGVGDCYLRFYLGDERGYVQFVVATGWYLPHIVQEQAHLPNSPIAVERSPWTFLRAPMAVDLGYHSPVPRYEGQVGRLCHLLQQGKCYYDGSTLQAERLLSVLYSEGSDGVWKALETFHQEIFGAVGVKT